MKNLIGIAVVASMMFACNGVNNTSPENQTNAELKNELLQAQHETELMKLNYEMELLKAKQEALTPAQTAMPGNSNAYLGAAAPHEARPTQQVDNEWTSSENDAYKPTTETKPAAEVKKKKGMSAPVKGALIGAGVGAATGAIASKNNRVKGAVIGAVAGAGVGAVTGVVIDKTKEKKANTPYYASNTFLN